MGYARRQTCVEDAGWGKCTVHQCPTMRSPFPSHCELACTALPPALSLPLPSKADEFSRLGPARNGMLYVVQQKAHEHGLQYTTYNAVSSTGGTAPATARRAA